MNLLYPTLALFASLPFIWPYHNYPFLTFYQEALAFGLGLLIMLIVALARDKWALMPLTPRTPTMFKALGVVLLIMLAQLFWNPHPERLTIGILYVAFAMVMCYAGSMIYSRAQITQAVDWIAGGLVVGGFLAAITGYMQYFELNTIFGQITGGERSSAGMFGAIAQRNMFANYLACSILGAMHLYVRRKLGAVAVLSLVLVLAVALAFSGSRSAWVYVAVIAAVCWYWTADRVEMPALAAVFVTAFCTARLGIAADAVVRVGPIIDLATGSSPRMMMLTHAWQQIAAHPFLGVGFGEYAYNMFMDAASIPDRMPGVDRHSHNLFAQVGAELGLPALVVLVVGVGIWLRRVSSGEWTWYAHTSGLIAGILLIQFGHSMVEFPLWWSSHLGLTVLLMSLMEAPTMERAGDSKWRGRALAVAALGGLATLAVYTSGYTRWAGWVQTAVAQASTTTVQQEADRLRAIPHIWMYHPYLELVHAETIVMTPFGVEQKLYQNGQAMHTFPTPVTAHRQALLLNLAGRDDEALAIMDNIKAAYPAYYKEITK